MPLSHINIPNSTPHAAMLHSALSRFEQAFNDLNDIRATLELMIDGDASQASQFSYMTKKLGSDGYDPTNGDPSAAQNAVSKAAWDELNSLLYKLNTDSEVTAVHAGIVQAFNKFR